MDYRIKYVAELLMYSGPTLEEIIMDAGQRGLSFDVKKTSNGINILTVTDELPYNLKVKDIYYYDQEQKMIKHLLKINDNIKVIFDKYKEVDNILLNIDEAELISA